jgi:hypothetical protein
VRHKAVRKLGIYVDPSRYLNREASGTASAPHSTVNLAPEHVLVSEQAIRSNVPTVHVICYASFRSEES